MYLLALAHLDAESLKAAPLNDPRVSLIVSCGDVAMAELATVCRESMMPIFAVRGQRDVDDWPRGVIDLHLSHASYGDLTLGGLQGASHIRDYAQKPYHADRVAELLKYFPKVDVFVSYVAIPALHTGDASGERGYDAFRTYVKRAKPRLLLHAHTENAETTLDETRVVGVRGWSIVEFG